MGGDGRQIWGWGAVALLEACSGKLLSITVSDTSTVVIERGTPLEVLLSDVGFGDFLAMDITSRDAIVNQGVEPGDISDVYFESLVLTAVDPGDADLSFIDELSFYVSAEGLPTVRVAYQDVFPEGQAEVPMVLDDVDLTEYVVSESMDLTTEVSGGRPPEDTTVEGAFELKVGATVKGACRQARGG